MLGAEPLAKPVAAVPIEGAVRPAHGAEAQGVRPSPQKSVQSRHSVLDLRPEPAAVGQARISSRRFAIFFADGRVPMKGRPVCGE